MRAIQDSDRVRDEFAAFIRNLPPSARRPSVPPGTLAAWEDRLKTVAERLRTAFGQVPKSPCELEPEILGSVSRPGYVIERLTFQSRPGVRVTANLYRPDRVEKPAAAVLSVHGHTSWARIDPGIQVRCIALAKLGYVCLSVDAFGAGERAVEPAPGAYHGALQGVSLWPADVPLIGLQVYDNRCAVDYLISRPEVDPTRLAVTGASGGGNQSLYAGATDDRFKAVVPVCGVGTYESYLQTACCVCEVNPGGLTYALTADLLAITAPRALLVVSATRDGLQFSVGEAARSLDYARSRFKLLGAEDRVRHLAVEAGHSYNQEMREALYGWLDRWLRGRGDGSPIAEPEVETEAPEAIRCYPDAASRPASIVTIPAFAHREGQARLASLPAAPDHRQAWEAEALGLKAGLRDQVLGGFPEVPRPRPPLARDDKEALIALKINPEPGLTLNGLFFRPAGDQPARGTAVIVTDGDLEPEAARGRCRAWTDSGHAACCVELRATGKRKPRTDVVHGAADHNEAEWSVWLGRPLLGQWVFDVLRWLEGISTLVQEESRIMGRTAPDAPLVLDAAGPIGVVAIMAAAFDDRVKLVCVENSLVGFAPAGPVIPRNLPMGLFAPKLLLHGDMGRISALTAPRRLVVVGGVELDGEPASPGRVEAAFKYTKRIYAILGADDAIEIVESRSDSTLLPRSQAGEARGS